jgi:hypothetical protein
MGAPEDAPDIVNIWANITAAETVPDTQQISRTEW